MVKELRRATALRYGAPSRLRKALDFTGGAMDDFMCNQGEKRRCGAMSLVGRTDAAFGDQSTGGKCRLRFGISPMAPSFAGPRHILLWASDAARTLARSSLGGGVYARGEMVDRATLIREICEPRERLAPGMSGLEACESLSTHLDAEKWSPRSIPPGITRVCSNRWNREN